MPKDYNTLYAKLRTGFPEQISQDVDNVIQQVCHICVYLDDLDSKGLTINLPFWREAKIMGSTTFPHKLSHFKRILSGLMRNHYSNFCDRPQSTEFNAVVTGGSSFKVSKQYKQLVIKLIDAVDRLKNNEKENCSQKCKDFVDQQFPDISIDSKYLNYPV